MIPCKDCLTYGMCRNKHTIYCVILYKYVQELDKKIPNNKGKLRAMCFIKEWLPEAVHVDHYNSRMGVRRTIQGKTKSYKTTVKSAHARIRA